MFNAGVAFGVAEGAGDFIVGIAKLAWNSAEGVAQAVTWALTKDLFVGSSVEAGYRWIWGETPGDAVQRKWNHITGAVGGVASVVTGAAEVFWKIVNDQNEAVLAVLTGDDATVRQMGEEYAGYFMLIGLILADTQTEWDGQTVFQKGQISGKIAFEVISIFAGAGSAKLASNIGKLKKIQSRFAKTEGFLGKVAQICGKWIAKMQTTKMCFVAGTLVHTSTGLVPIEKIQPGDMVFARDEFAPERQALRKVLGTAVTHTTILHDLTFVLPKSPACAEISETLSASAPHPFYVENRKPPCFVPAEDLRAGDLVSLRAGNTGIIVSNRVAHAPPGRYFTTYNFEVENYHTYFVGFIGLWVHNSGTSFCEGLFLVFERLLQRHNNNVWDAYTDLRLKGFVGRDARLADDGVGRLQLYTEARRRHFTDLGGGIPPWRSLSGQTLTLTRPPSSTGEMAAELAKNIEHVTGVKKPAGFASHHIVPPGYVDEAGNADRLRQLLSQHGVHLNEAANGTYIPHYKATANAYPSLGPRHGPLHSDSMMQKLWDRLNSIQGPTASKLRDELQKIAFELNQGTFIP
jgi:hypothetical protein